MSRASGVSKEDAGRFRRTVMNITRRQFFYANIDLFICAYWLNGRKAAPSLAEHWNRLHAVTAMDMRGLGLEGFDFRADYPELYRYADADDASDDELKALERKAAGMFYDGFLSRPEYPAGEGTVYARMLTRGAYTMGAVDRLIALARKGKLSAGGFRPFITMDDMPDYATVKAWDDEALERMNAIAVWYEGRSAAARMYDHDYKRACTPSPGKPVRTADVVRLTLDMAEQGMEDSKRAYRDWLEDLDAAKFEIEHDFVIELAADSPDCWPYFTPVDDGDPVRDPVQAYKGYLKRRDGQA